MPFKKSLFIRLICILLISACWSGVVLVNAYAGGLEFADHLFGIGEYDRAITEYLRYKFETGIGEKQVAVVDYKTALCYQKLGKSEKAAEILNRLYAEKSYLTEEALFDLALLSYKDSRLSNSVDELNEYITKFPNGQFKDDVEYMLAVSYMQDGNFKEVRRVLTAIKQNDGAYANSAEDLLRELKAEGNIKLKSKRTAGMLSTVLPGAGQFYAGRKGDGIATLLINSVVTGSAILAFDNDEDVFGYFMSFWGASFYLGNIYSAISAANKYNRQKTEDFKEGLLSGVRIDMVGSKRDQILRIKVKF